MSRENVVAEQSFTVSRERKEERNRGKRNFLPQSLIVKKDYKIVKTSRRKRKKGKGICFLMVEIWDGHNARRKKKERKTKLKKNKRERKRGKRNCLPQWWKLGKTKKKKEKKFVKAWRRKGNKRKVKWKKKKKRKGDSEMNYPFLCCFFYPFPSLEGWECHVVYHWEERNKKFPLPHRVWINRPPNTDR